MKRYYFISIILLQLTIQSCTDDSSYVINYFEVTKPNESNIPDSIKNLYYLDAARLSVRHLYKFNSPDTLSTQIPEALIDMLYRGLIHIYNSKKLDHVEFITKSIPIHTFFNPDVNIITVAVDTSYSWTKAWQSGSIITDNSQLNDLIVPYNFRVTKFFKIVDYYLAVLKTEVPLNLFALSHEIEKVEGVLHANPDGYAGDGNDIEAAINYNNIEYVFSIGWGDCPAGCISRHYWNFRVWFNGHVEFIKEYGNPLEIKT